ncbi:hypothetical protein ABZ826_26685, partial [Streptomyces sp. NPDC047515]|uniref:hypothetical protein n=1 Tax=Streptomyces sp. NPDC047515 TaxID=3155380 RepID=UPI0033CD6C70
RSSSDNTSSAIGRPIFAMEAVYLFNEFSAQDARFPGSGGPDRPVRGAGGRRVGETLNRPTRRHGPGPTGRAVHDAPGREGMGPTHVELAVPTPRFGGETVVRRPDAGETRIDAETAGGDPPVDPETAGGDPLVNAETAGGDSRTSFGGSGHSGFVGREQGRAARDFFTTTTAVYARSSQTVAR